MLRSHEKEHSLYDFQATVRRRFEAGTEMNGRANGKLYGRGHGWRSGNISSLPAIS